MKKVSGFTKRMVAILLSSMLAVGTIPGTVLGAEVQENTVQEEEAITTYTVILDANGGHFENEWDDVLGDYIESTEILNKQIPVGGTVTTFPVYETDDQQTQAMSFSGWSLERDGELVSQGDEEYTPVDNCVLYAAWNAAEYSNTSTEVEELLSEDEAWEDIHNQDTESVDTEDQNTEYAEESSDQTEEPGINVTQESKYTNSEDSNGDEDVAPAQETISARKNEHEESVREDVVMSIVASGTCGDERAWMSEGEEGSGLSGDNLIWTLDNEGVLTISGEGKMTDDYFLDYESRPWNSYSNDIIKVVVENGVTNISGDSFYNCANLKSVEIADTVTRIGDSAFEKCSSLKSVIIPENVTYIGDRIFYGCASLTVVNIPVGVTNIYGFAFANCSNLKYVEIPNSVTGIGDGAFQNCSCLKDVTIPDSVTKIGAYAFQGCKAIVSLTIPRNITTLSEYTFSGCSSLTDFIIPQGVKNISNFVFAGCSSFTDVTIPESVTYIGAGAFQGCIGLNSVTIPDSVTVIGSTAFERCSSLKSIRIPKYLKIINKLSFLECSSLKKVIIPTSITNMGSWAFKDCSDLTEIFFEGNYPSIYSDTFKGVTATAYYPANDTTWTEAVRKNYEGTITWLPWNPDTGIVNPAEDGIKSLVPSNNAVDVDHSVNPKVVFSESLRLSGNGRICLYESNSSTPVEVFEAVTSSHAVIIEPSSVEDTSSTLNLFFDTELKPNTQYTISIDSDSLVYLEWDSTSQEYVETGNLFSGIEKGVWSFTTTSTDYMHFPNQTDEIDESMYYYLFKPGKAFLYSHVWDNSRGKKGTCYGWAYTVGAKRQQYNSINAFGGKLCELKPDSHNLNNNYSLVNYIQMAYLYQFSERKLKEDKQNEDKYDQLYQAIKNQINGSGEDIIIAVYEGKKGHALYPVKIISENNNDSYFAA